MTRRRDGRGRFKIGWPPPKGGLVRVNGHIGRLVGGRDGRYLGAYLSHGGIDNREFLPPEKRKLLVGTAKPPKPGDAQCQQQSLPTNEQMGALESEYFPERRAT